MLPRIGPVTKKLNCLPSVLPSMPGLDTVALQWLAKQHCEVQQHVLSSISPWPAIALDKQSRDAQFRRRDRCLRVHIDLPEPAASGKGLGLYRRAKARKQEAEQLKTAIRALRRAVTARSGILAGLHLVLEGSCGDHKLSLPTDNEYVTVWETKSLIRALKAAAAPVLTHVSLCYLHIDCRELPERLELPGVRELTISRCLLEHGMEELLDACPSLSKLVLKGEIGKYRGNHEYPTASRPGITHLDISEFKVNDGGLLTTALLHKVFTWAPNLEWLKLHKLTTCGLSALTAQAGLKHVEVTCISGDQSALWDPWQANVANTLPTSRLHTITCYNLQPTCIKHLLRGGGLPHFKMLSDYKYSGHSGKPCMTLSLEDEPDLYADLHAREFTILGLSNPEAILTLQPLPGVLAVPAITAFLTNTVVLPQFYGTLVVCVTVQELLQLMPVLTPRAQNLKALQVGQAGRSHEDCEKLQACASQLQCSLLL